jgi:hypothetical protein
MPVVVAIAIKDASARPVSLIGKNPQHSSARQLIPKTKIDTNSNCGRRSSDEAPARVTLTTTGWQSFEEFSDDRLDSLTEQMIITLKLFGDCRGSYDPQCFRGSHAGCP